MADGVRLDTSDLTAYADVLQRVARVGAVAFTDELRDGGDDTAAEAVLRVPRAAGPHKHPEGGGHLWQHIEAEPVKASRRRAEVTVKADKPYAVYLELGTSKVGPRPYLRPALNKARPAFLRDVGRKATRLLRVR